jgi:Asp-tRNA(Asn)/Glu-tRNA(Gln) amidotransferase A subunit family amidase
MNDASSAIRYHPSNRHLRTFHDARERFVDGSDTPSDYLDRCLETIEAREPDVQAWVVLNEQVAREAAKAASERYRDGQALSPVDGMPVGIKDVIQTRDMPTALGSPIFAGRETGIDSASVDALRRAGAVILGKTVTTEFAFMVPGPTTNPFDSGRTPGGSSSGSAAAVGAGMVPAALGNQVVGSVIRPAAYCANYALKPTLGALHLGEGLSLSQLHVGVHAGSLEDMWSVAYAIANGAGGDPGYPGLYGPPMLSPSAMPRTLIALETEGWALCGDATHAGFARVIEQLRDRGVRVLTRHDDRAIDCFERTIEGSVPLCRILCSYEMRWALRNYRETGRLSDELGLWLDMAEELTPADYRDALRRREQMRTDFEAIAPLADAVVTLACPGPAPALNAAASSGEDSYVFKTGSPSFNAATSALGAPCITLPLISVHGMPVGVQLIAQAHTDWSLTGIAAWCMGTLQPVVV